VKGIHVLNRSHLQTENGLPYFQGPEMSRLGWVRHAFLTRRGGVSIPPYDSLNLGDGNGDLEERVSTNRQRIAQAFRFDPRRLILLHQMSRDHILLLKEPLGSLPPLLEYDALITDAPETFLGILTADCLPIFVVDQKKSLIAAIHAGRQGTALHITTQVLRKMKEEFDCSSSHLLITIGPSIGPRCYEIDEKVFLPEWEPFAAPKGKGKWDVDLAGINIAQMEAEGIHRDQISWIDLCTHCHPDLFFSYRKEGQTGRQLSFIGIME